MLGNLPSTHRASSESPGGATGYSHGWSAVRRRRTKRNPWNPSPQFHHRPRRGRRNCSRQERRTLSNPSTTPPLRPDEHAICHHASHPPPARRLPKIQKPTIFFSLSHNHLRMSRARSDTLCAHNTALPPQLRRPDFPMRTTSSPPLPHPVRFDHPAPWLLALCLLLPLLPVFRIPYSAFPLLLRLPPSPSGFIPLSLLLPLRAPLRSCLP